MANIANYSSAQDLSNAFREEWSPTMEELTGQFTVSKNICGKVAEGFLSANGGDSFNYLTIQENETQDIDPYVDQTIGDSQITVDQMVLSETSEYVFKQEEDEKGLLEVFQSFFARRCITLFNADIASSGARTVVFVWNLL